MLCSMNTKLLADTTLNETTGCREWNKYRLPNGYGRTRHLGKNILAHRFAWIIEHPEDTAKIIGNPRILVCHKCDNPPCCNPNHLFLGSHQDNTRDCIAKGRMNIHPAQSAARFQRIRKLTHEQVDAIRAGIGLNREIAAKFGVSEAYVSMIKRGISKNAPRRES